MRSTAVRWFFVLLAASTPAFAGQVFVPVVGHHASDSRIAYRTLVWVTNLGQAEEAAGSRFVEQGVDGTAQPAAAGGVASVMVPAGATMLLANGAPEGKSGLIEVSGGADLEVRARLEALDGERGGQAPSGAAVQAVSAANALAPGQVAHLQGLGRDAGSGGALTDLGLLNLADQAAACQVSAFRADGSQIAPAAALGLPPLGARFFEDAFGQLGEQRLAGARFEVSCDQPFYAHAAVFAAGGAVSETVTPSQGTADLPVTGALQPIVAIDASAPSTPAPAGTAAGPDGSPQAGLAATAATAPMPAVPQRSVSAAGVVTLAVPGTFLQATNSNSFISYDLAAVPGLAYHRATVDFDLTIKDFNKVLLFTGVTSFRRPNKTRKNRVLYYAMQLVNRKRKTILDLGVQDRLVRTVGPWQAGHTYHLLFTYDLRGRQVKLDVFENGRHLYQISGPPLHPDLSANGNPLTVDFGQTGIG
ncbi:MAG TPA: hypothetical protein VE075_11595, partial [Thermoanaerobaculia bacterium]|nr:hypothetical protein [Thermoanaerobaculia bacterium]